MCVGYMLLWGDYGSSLSNLIPGLLLRSLVSLVLPGYTKSLLRLRSTVKGLAQSLPFLILLSLSLLEMKGGRGGSMQG